MYLSNRTTEQWQKIDSAHHLHPFTDFKELINTGTRVIISGKGNYVIDSDNNKILDMMAGLWCVNIGYGRKELAEVAYEQMQLLPYYNSFFKTATTPSIELSKVLADIAPEGIERFFYGSSGSESNDTVVRLVRRYWDILGKNNNVHKVSRHNLAIVISNKLHGATTVASSIYIASQLGISEWLSVDLKELKGTVSSIPEREDILPDINENLVVEYYSK